MLFINQISGREAIRKKGTIIRNRDQSTVGADQSTGGADHPGLPASVDRCPNPSIETLNSHRFVTGLCCNCEPLYF